MNAKAADLAVWVVNKYQQVVTRRPCTDRTKHTYMIPETRTFKGAATSRKRHRDTSSEIAFDTEEEAHAWLVEKARRRVQEAESELADAKQALSRSLRFSTKKAREA